MQHHYCIPQHTSQLLTQRHNGFICAPWQSFSASSGSQGLVCGSNPSRVRQSRFRGSAFPYCLQNVERDRGKMAERKGNSRWAVSGVFFNTCPGTWARDKMRNLSKQYYGKRNGYVWRILSPLSVRFQWLMTLLLAGLALEHFGSLCL